MMSTLTTINAETTMVHDTVSWAIQRSDTVASGNCDSVEPQKCAPASLPQLWILIEWETPFLGDQDSYAVITSSEIIVPFGSETTADSSSRLYTGKLIQVKRGNQILPAYIVISSESKEFVETQLWQLRKMDSETVPYMKQASHVVQADRPASNQFRQASHQTQLEWSVLQQKQNVQTNPMKRQRVYESDDHPLSPPLESSVGMSRSTARAVSPPVRTIIPRAFQTRTDYRPMTFDQQTQTVGSGTSLSLGCSIEAQIERILSCLEGIMVEQRSYRMECEFNRKLLLELNEKVNGYKDRLDKGVVIAVGRDEASEEEAAIEQKESIQPNEPAQLANSNNNEINRKCEMRTIARGTANAAAVVRTNRQRTSHCEAPIETSNLPIVFIDDSSMSVTITDLPAPQQSVEKEKKVNDEDRVTASSERGTVREMIECDWNDERSTSSSDIKSTAEDPLVDAPLTGTRAIPESVLDKINWSNYKAATRKILMHVFTRKELATHSLTGRPSPAFRNEHQKPVKHQLDPAIVAGVVKLVSTRCKVEEGLVRSAITTKLADENKMYRMRELQNPTQLQRKNTGRTNKENVNEDSN